MKPSPPEEPSLTKTDLLVLTRLIARLRAPNGCPWDREQTVSSVRAYVIEEAHEVAAAIDAEDWHELGAELGDLLFQVAFLSELAREQGHFGPADVISGVEAKMIDRHPHVFGDETLADSTAVRKTWEQRKLEKGPADRSLLAGVTLSTPALQAAYRMTSKAADVGFDWNDPQEVLSKVDEELDELKHAVSASAEPTSPEELEPVLLKEHVEEEMGDLLFTIANLARHLELDPEAALAKANLKFRRRFEAVETKLREIETPLATAERATLETLWNEVKRNEQSTP